LVDRIVPGFPRGKEEEYAKELGYEDKLLDEGEPFGLWVIGDERLRSTFDIGGDWLTVEYTSKIEIYKQRKVRILNGAHTSMVLGAYLAGFDYVGQCMEDEDVRRQLDQSVFGEIVPTVNLPREQAEGFARAVFERFENPFVKHALLSISLNSIAKWRARVLPSLKDSFAANKKLPKWLTYSLAALLAFYRTTEKGDKCLIGHRGNEKYEIHDDADKLEFIASVAGKSTEEYVKAVLGEANWWDEDLNKVPDFTAEVTKHLKGIEEQGAKAYIKALGA
jgi:tagaturonate reductase